MEAYNITNKKASDRLQKKFNMHEGKHSERSAANNEMYVPEKTPKLVYMFLLYWTEIVQYDTKGHKRSEDNRWLQKPTKGMDMEEHPLIVWLVLTLSKKDLYTLYLYHCCLNPSISLYLCTILDF